MKKLDFSVINIGKICCDGCDKFLCYGFVDHADDCGFVCGSCRQRAWLGDAFGKIKDLQRRIKDVQKQLTCQNSSEGHVLVDITNQTFCLGKFVFKCKKCGCHKYEPMKAHILYEFPFPSKEGNDIINVKNIEFKPWVG